MPSTRVLSKHDRFEYGRLSAVKKTRRLYTPYTRVYPPNTPLALIRNVSFARTQLSCRYRAAKLTYVFDKWSYSLISATTASLV